jgi:hypothetical protein
VTSQATISSHLHHLDASPAVMRALGALVALHGAAHYAGTEASFATAADGGSVDYLAGVWTISDPTLLRVFGVVWALLGLAFIFAAVITWQRRPEWARVVALVAMLSLAVAVIALWSSIIGVVVNVALIAVAAVGGAFTRKRVHT